MRVELPGPCLHLALGDEGEEARHRMVANLRQPKERPLVDEAALIQPIEAFVRRPFALDCALLHEQQRRRGESEAPGPLRIAEQCRRRCLPTRPSCCLVGLPRRGRDAIDATKGLMKPLSKRLEGLRPQPLQPRACALR